jgi:peptidoglycan/LPS O-acetylase OafA/YrhL
VTASRVTREHGLDLLRAAAILGTLAFHSQELSGLPSRLGPLLAYGWLGVDMFFVLSGFLIGRQVFRAGPNASYARELRSFWMRRWFRTLPLYFVVLFFYLIIKPKLFRAPFMGHAWAYLIFVQNYTMRPGLVDFVQSWSLCVEEQFYLVFPIVAFAVAWRRGPRSWAWALPLFASMLARAVTVLPAGTEGRAVAFMSGASWATHLHLDGLAAGLVLAAFEAQWRAWSPPARRLCALAGILVLLGTGAAFGPRPATPAAVVLYFSLMAFAFALLLIGASGLRLPRFAHAVVVRISIWSYGAYLWFGLVIRAVARAFGERAPWALQVTTLLVGTFLMAWLTYEVVEEPMLRVRDAAINRVAGPRDARGEVRPGGG